MLGEIVQDLQASVAPYLPIEAGRSVQRIDRHTEQVAAFQEVVIGVRFVVQSELASQSAQVVYPRSVLEPLLPGLVDELV